jgi:hypothetical protein
MRRANHHRLSFHLIFSTVAVFAESPIHTLTSLADVPKGNGVDSVGILKRSMIYNSFDMSSRNDVISSKLKQLATATWQLLACRA